MPTWKKLCCATDFSKPSREALAVAADLAKTFDATLLLLHVVELPIHVTGDMAMLPGAGQVRQLVEEGRNHLAETKLEAEQRGALRVITEARIAGGSAGEEILRFAGETGADLIVVGTHGRTGLKHFLLGSVAERIVRQAACPVLTVRLPDEER